MLNGATPEPTTFLPTLVHINADMDSATACSVLLVGQPTLARQLRMGVFAALDQRIATRYQINPMDLGESAEYLRHHLALVGRTDALFADDAIARLHKASLGLPRAFNNAAIAALIAATTAAKHWSMMTAPGKRWPNSRATELSPKLRHHLRRRG